MCLGFQAFLCTSVTCVSVRWGKMAVDIENGLGRSWFARSSRLRWCQSRTSQAHYFISQLSFHSNYRYCTPRVVSRKAERCIRWLSDKIMSISLQRTSRCVRELKNSNIYRDADKSLARPGRKQSRKHVRDARDFNNIETRAANFPFTSPPVRHSVPSHFNWSLQPSVRDPQSVTDSRHGPIKRAVRS